MPEKSKLDSVIKLREKEEDKQLAEMARADAAVQDAERVVEECRQRLRADSRQRADVALWQIAESAHSRLLQELRGAERALAAAREAQLASRKRYREAHSKAESVRRLVATRAEEAQQAELLVERRELDEIGIGKFARSARRP